MAAPAAAKTEPPAVAIAHEPAAAPAAEAAPAAAVAAHPVAAPKEHEAKAAAPTAPADQKSADQKPADQKSAATAAAEPAAAKPGKAKDKETKAAAVVAMAGAPDSKKPTSAARAEAEAPAVEKDSAKAAPSPGATATDKPSDKDIAREAWRRNLPDISTPEDNKTSILIPIKGSIEGATYHVSTKPKSVVVNLPKADPLITMRFYKIRREGLSNLWIKQEEGEGTTLRLNLNEATAPQVEIKDDYVRITVRKPADLPTSTATE